MFELKNESRFIKRLLLLCCLVFFSLIIFSIFYYGNSNLLGNFYAPNNDDVKFIRSAWILSQTGIYVYHKTTIPTVFMMPGLPYVLAFLMEIFGHYGGITALRVIQAILQVLSLLLIFFIGKKSFNSKVAITAVVLDTFYICEIWVPTLILTETFFKFFVLCTIYFSMFAIEKKESKYYIFGGLFFGGAALFRPTIAAFPIIILVMWIIYRYKFKELLKFTIIVSFIFCTILSPWWVRNYKLLYKFIPFTLATGNPMLQGTYINYDQSTTKTDGLNYSQFNYGISQNTEIESNNKEIAISKYRLINLFPKEPLKFIKWYTIGKTWNQINFPFYWKEILSINFITAEVYHILLLTFSILGTITYFRSKDKNLLTVILFLTILYFIVIYLPFFTMGRYFYPSAACYILFAAYFIVTCNDRLNITKRIDIKLKLFLKKHQIIDK